MGCGSSKADEQPAVALCRERCAFLEEAIHRRYALAQAHLAYLHSLKSVGVSLHDFFHQLQFLDSSAPAAGPASSSPVWNLPPLRKGNPHPQPYASPPPPAASAAAFRHSHSHSNSGSHIHFHSDSDDIDSESAGSLHHHHHQHHLGLDEDGDSSPLHHPYHFGYPDHDNPMVVGSSYPGGPGFMNINYMKNQPTTPSVVYQHRPMSPETVHMTDSSSYYPYSHDRNPNPNPHNSYYTYSNYGEGFFGSSPPRQPYNSSPPFGAGPSSSSKPPPPPPSPPSGSAWDFLNPFESFDRYYPPYTPSRDSREVREEEGIPDLEDVDFQQEVVKEVHGDQKLVEGGGGSGGGGGGDGAGSSYSKAAVEDKDGKLDDPDLIYRARPTASMDNEPAQYEVHVVDKKVVNEEERSGDGGNVAASKARPAFSGDFEVVKEIRVQFERASDAGNELAKILEVGKLPYDRKHAAYQVSSKMLHVITPSPLAVSSQPSTSKMADPSLDIDDVDLRSENLSSTLQKLYLWEKKLYEEVKVEEKTRVVHERKCRKLKRLDERGAEAHKVDATRTLVRSLSTKIRIAIQIVDKISVKISKLRDENLWPQLNEFIQGLSRMWKSMLECHRGQCQAIGEARRLDAIASHKNLNDAYLEAILQLERELIKWTLRFSCWFGAQKGYVRALNNWLLKFLLYVPEETPDGEAPFSPGRIGAPPVFVICNQWSLALESISEKEVIDSMRDFVATVHQLREQDKLEMRQRMMANKDVERKVKNFEMEDQKLQKELQALDKRMILIAGDGSGLSLTGQVVYQSDTNKNCSLQVGLLHIFETMEKFTANNLRVYEELLQRIEEDGLDEDHKEVS